METAFRVRKASILAELWNWYFMKAAKYSRYEIFSVIQQSFWKALMCVVA
jgi:hypothetical protein